MKKLKTKNNLLFLFFIIVLTIGFFSFVNFSLAESDCDSITDEQEKKECEEKEQEKKEEIEDKKDDLNDKKEDLQKEIEKAEVQANILQNDLSIVQQSLNFTKTALADTQQEIESKEQEIDRNNKEIELLDQRNKIYQKALSSALRSFYYQQNESVTLTILNTESGSKFLGDLDSYNSIKQEILGLMDDIKETKESVQNKKSQIESAIEEKKDLYSLQQKQEQTLISEKVQTQDQIVRKQATIAELNSKLAEVESDLSGLLGESVEASDIVEAAKIASEKTGVRKSFILGMLVKETNLGRYTGGCTYEKSKMGDANAKIFKRICEDLDYNYKKKKVSCPLSYGIGGAMGVSQFMPTTWVGYESKVEQYTGHSPADPWSLTDGVMAMAIKLANDGASKKSGEYDAARRYYCGSNINRSVCNNYADDVMYWADNYKDRL